MKHDKWRLQPILNINSQMVITMFVITKLKPKFQLWSLPKWGDTHTESCWHLLTHILRTLQADLTKVRAWFHVKGAQLQLCSQTLYVQVEHCDLLVLRQATQLNRKLKTQRKTEQFYWISNQWIQSKKYVYPTLNNKRWITHEMWNKK